MINRSFKFGAGIIIIPLINFFFSPFKGDLIYAEEIIERKEIEFTNSVSSKINQKKKKSSFIDNEVGKIDNSKFLINKNPYKLNKTLFLNRKGFVKINGPKITLELKNANAMDALQSLSKLGNYGFIYIPSFKKDSKSSIDENERLVSLSFIEEEYEIVINSILIASGLQGKTERNILFVGENVLGKGFNPEISKVYTMNNTSAASAAEYLASLGASINKVFIYEAGTNNNKPFEESVNSKNDDYSIQSYGAYQGPLKGLTGTSDTRLENITLVGSKELIELAEKYLAQIDRVQKQVALSVKILDVNIDDEDKQENSFALKFNNPTAYILNDSGSFDLAIGDINSWRTSRTAGVGTLNLNEANKFDFLNWLSGKVASKETTVLASPTLILSETRDKIEGGQAVSGTGSFSQDSIGREYGNEAFITVGTSLITNYNVTPGQNGGAATCEAVFGIAGLSFGGKLHKINSDDYITFSLSPEISSVTSTQDIGTCGLVNILSLRRLDTGALKVKSGNTLALTGVMSDTKSEIKTKLPILGDIPLLGNMFKSKSKGLQKSELIILVTPNILNESYEFNKNSAQLELLNDKKMGK